MESKTSIGNKSVKTAKGAFKNKKSLMPQASTKISKQISSTGQSTGSTNGEKKKKPPPKIWDNELQKMVIKPLNFLMIRADLQKERQSTGMSLFINEELEKSVVVRKSKPEIAGKTVMVLKPASPSAEIQYSKDISYAGPRFSDKGKFITHSILGGLEDFKKMALQKGEFQHLFASHTSTMKRRKPKVDDFCRPLKTWKHHLKDWKNLRRHLSNKVSRPAENLLMNTPDIYPRPILDRQHVHAALEAMYASHGEHRVASRFWRQRVPRGDDLTGIHVTLNQSEKGTVMASEQFVDVPNSIKQEKGVIKRNYPAYYTHYLQEQESAVSDVIHILNPHHPLIEDLSITGKTQKPSSAHSGGDGPNVVGDITLEEVHIGKRVEEDIFEKSASHSSTIQDPITTTQNGPAVMIGSQVFGWVGPNLDHRGQTAGIASVLFEGVVGKNLLSYLEIYNVGTTVIYYEWTKNEKKGLENLPSFQNMKFYFFTEGGVLAPGEKLKLPILFKANIGGIFSESWKLVTRPLLCSGADIVINLKSVISVTKLPNQELDKVEKCLTHRNALTIASELIEDIFHIVKTPLSPLSPEIEHVSQEQEFQQRFPGMIYHSGKAMEMETFYNTILTSIPREFPRQECSSVAVKQALGELISLDPTNVEDEEKCWEETCYKYSCLNTFDHLCSSLLFTWPTPVYSQPWERYKIGLSTLQGAVDRFMDMTFRTARLLGLPLRVDEEEEALDKAARKAPPKKSLSVKPKKKETEKAVVNNLAPGGQSKDDKLKSSPSNKGRPKTCSPESNPDPGDKAPDSFIPVVVSKVCKSDMEKYRERVHLQAYLILESAIDEMFRLFED
ncbi:MYCBP-associated protein-like [Ylistrum balloti]|uniref:MYCBP-associated protein-like n=1 Tax=Ylistrum balloti TaxID=509963 RepID=UPI0029059E16|nr:MYCBP-associated protein-like [Ylistrum balloti]